MEALTTSNSEPNPGTLEPSVSPTTDPSVHPELPPLGEAMPLTGSEAEQASVWARVGSAALVGVVAYLGTKNIELPTMTETVPDQAQEVLSQTTQASVIGLGGLGKFIAKQRQGVGNFITNQRKAKKVELYEQQVERRARAKEGMKGTIQRKPEDQDPTAMIGPPHPGDRSIDVSGTVSRSDQWAVRWYNYGRKRNNRRRGIQDSHEFNYGKPTFEKTSGTWYDKNGVQKPVIVETSDIRRRRTGVEFPAPAAQTSKGAKDRKKAVKQHGKLAEKRRKWEN